MPGYSRTPLPKKLGIKDGARVCSIKMPPEVGAELADALRSCTPVRDGKAEIDFAIFFSKSNADLTKQFRSISRRLTPSGMLWVSWPKKSSGIATDLNENVVREIGFAAGLVDVKVCAVTEVWSALKFVRRLKDRSSLGKEK
jgi:hypothetical protein